MNGQHAGIHQLNIVLSDVKVLREGCELYRKEALKLMGLDSLVTAVTGAHAINQAFRMSYMEPQSIAVVSDHGLKPDTQYSMIACIWLEWVMECEAKAGNPIKIQYAFNGGERKIGKYHVDGYVFTFSPLCTYPGCSGNIAFEFNGVSISVNVPLAVIVILADF